VVDEPVGEAVSLFEPSIALGAVSAAEARQPQSLVLPTALLVGPPTPVGQAALNIATPGIAGPLHE